MTEKRSPEEMDRLLDVMNAAKRRMAETEALLASGTLPTEAEVREKAAFLTDQIKRVSECLTHLRPPQPSDDEAA